MSALGSVTKHDFPNVCDECGATILDVTVWRGHHVGCDNPRLRDNGGIPHVE